MPSVSEVLVELIANFGVGVWGISVAVGDTVVSVGDGVFVGFMFEEMTIADASSVDGI
jgi:hypothetical protein